MRVLFLCTANSARSQMAEGFARHLGEVGVQVYSAGTEPRELNPLAVATMREKGIDISGQRAKSLAEVPGEFDYVVTLCGEAAEACPNFPGKFRRIHWPLPDPAKAKGSEAQRLGTFRNVRDWIERLVVELFSSDEFRRRLVGG